MATSETYTYAPNRAQVIEKALAMNGREADADSSASASSSLNMLIKSLNVNKTDINVIVRTELALTSGDEDYTTDALGVDGMFLAVDGNDYLVTPISKIQYDAKVNKQTSGRPSEFYHDKQAGLLYVWPSPDSTYTATYGKVRQYQDMTDDEQTFDFPASAIKMLVFGLAYLMSFESGLDAGTQDRLEAQFKRAERDYIVANMAYTKRQTSTSCMVV